MKTVLFVPGFKEGLKSSNYQAVLDLFEQKGYQTEFVSVDWLNKTAQDWALQLDAVYKKFRREDTILAGFSYGATTAMLSAAKRNPYKLWLFSLPPYFASDLPHLKQWWLRYIGKRRVQNFKQMEFSALATNIDCPTLAFVGEEEANKYPRMRHRAQQVGKQFAQGQFIEIPDTPHDVTTNLYLKYIAQNI